MKKMSVLNIKGEKVNDITLNEEVWGITPNDAVLYDAITLARNSERQGTHETKTRSEVSGGGRKPWRQKGTGRARQGSIRAAQWYHGGIVFGPHMRSYDKKMNRKERRLALKSALAYKALDSELVIVDSFKLETTKTKEALNIFSTACFICVLLALTSTLKTIVLFLAKSLLFSVMIGAFITSL